MPQQVVTLVKIFRFDTFSAWTWIKGTNSASNGSSGIYPTSKGVYTSSARPLGRYRAATFSDPADPSLLYLHGGVTSSGRSAELWGFNISSYFWGWLSGTNSTNSFGIYPPALNMNYPAAFPSARFSHFCVSDPQLQRAVYCYGGAISETFDATYFLGDLWKYDIAANVWEWVWGSSSGSTKRFSAGLGVNNPLNMPGARSRARGWSSSSEMCIYMFGGISDSVMVSTWADLWKFDLLSQTWTWIHGSSTMGDGGVYSSKNFNALNYPSSRMDFGAAVIDPSNQLEIVLIHGGVGYFSLDDVWLYSPALNQFKWVSGSPPGNGSAPTYDIMLKESSLTIPGKRMGQIVQPFVNGSFLNSSFLFLFGGARDYNANLYSDVLKLRVEIPCTFGTFLNSSSLECTRCPAGKFSSLTISDSSCYQCPSGSFSGSVGSSECNLCAAGRFGSSSGSSTCDHCLLGAYTTANGSSSCSFCSDGTTSDVSGTFCIDCPTGKYSKQTQVIYQCESCPSFSSTQSARSRSIQECFCVVGFYGSPFASNGSCKLCQKSDGMSCPQNSTIPYIKSGYYRNPDIIEAAMQCVPFLACEESGYSLSAQCSSGYTGVSCGECFKGTHYRQGLLCQKCPNPIWKWIGVCLVVPIVGCILERALSKPNYALPVDVKLAFGGLQLLALLPYISAKWPKSLLQILDVLTVTNLNIDLFAPECSVPMSFWKKYFLKMILPFILQGFLIILIIWKMIRQKMKTSPTGHHHYTKKFMINRSISLFLLGISSLYALLTSTALAPFSCVEVGSSKFVIASSADISCYEGEWVQNLPTMSFFLFLYFVCFPLGVLYVLVINRENLNSTQFQERYGNFVNGYRWSYSYWHVVVLFKNLTISTLMKFLSSNQEESLSSFATVIILILFVLLNISCMPFRQTNDMIQSCVWIALLVVLILSNSLVFSNDKISNESKRAAEVLAIIFICLALALFVFRISKSVIIKLNKLMKGRHYSAGDTVCINSEELLSADPICLPFNARNIDQIVLLPRKHFMDCKEDRLSKHVMFLSVSNTKPVQTIETQQL
jgi:hypothetical protein